MPEPRRLHRLVGIAPVVAAGLLASAAVLWLARRPVPPAPVHPASRVILFAPNLTEAAWAMGYGANIVAIDDYTVWPPALLGRPRVGGMVDPNLERILALSPDLLVVQGVSERLREFARVNSIRLGSVTMDTRLSAVLSGFSTLDSLLSGGGTQRAQAVIAYLQRQLDEVAERAGTLDHPSVLLVLGRQPDAVAAVWTAGEGAFLTDLVSIAGGRSVTAQNPRPYLELSVETLTALAPEVIVELRPSETLDAEAMERMKSVWRRAGFARARVVACTFDGCQIPGPRIGETTRVLFGLLHPDAPPLPSDPVAPWDTPKDARADGPNAPGEGAP